MTNGRDHDDFTLPKWPQENQRSEKMEIMKATISDHMLNIIQNINSLYQTLQSVQD